MGSLAAKPTIYLIEITEPSNSNLPFLKISTDQLALTWEQNCLKFVLNYRLALSETSLVRKNHHRAVILVEDSSDFSQAHVVFGGCSILLSRWFYADPRKALIAVFNENYCPVSIIFQKFHPSFLQCYLSAFSSRGTQTQSYSINEFLNSMCPSRRVVCSQEQLQPLCEALKNGIKKSSSKKDTRHIFCFCRTDPFLQTNSIHQDLKMINCKINCSQNLLDILWKINCIDEQTPSTETVIFYSNPEETDQVSLVELRKRLNKFRKNARVKRVTSLNEIIEKVKIAVYNTIVIIPKVSIQSLQICDALQAEGLQDRAIIVQRDREIDHRFLDKIQKVFSENRSITLETFQKRPIFYGTEEGFKNALQMLPNVSFKQTIDNPSRIRCVLSHSQEIVISSMRCCECVFGKFSCTVLMIGNAGCPDCLFYPINSQIQYLQFLRGSPVRAANFRFLSFKTNCISNIFNDTFQAFDAANLLLTHPEDYSPLLFFAETDQLQFLSRLAVKLLSSHSPTNHPITLTLLVSNVKGQLKELAQNKALSPATISHLNLLQSHQNSYHYSQTLLTALISLPDFHSAVNSAFKRLLTRHSYEPVTIIPTLLFTLFLGFTQITANATPIALRLNVAVESSQINKILQKKESVTTTEFLICSEFDGDYSNPCQLILELQEQDLSVVSPIWQSNGIYLIPPFTKLIASSTSPIVFILGQNQQFLTTFICSFSINFKSSQCSFIDSATKQLFQSERISSLTKNKNIKKSEEKSKNGLDSMPTWMLRKYKPNAVKHQQSMGPFDVRNLSSESVIIENDQLDTKINEADVNEKSPKEKESNTKEDSTLEKEKLIVSAQSFETSHENSGQNKSQKKSNFFVRKNSCNQVKLEEEFEWLEDTEVNKQSIKFQFIRLKVFEQ